MSYPCDFLVFIGRFQPFHAGHLAVVQAGLRQAGHLIVLCGSAHQPRSTRNPFTWQEREAMLRACIAPEDQSRLLVAPVMDSPYNDTGWLRSVQTTVQTLVRAHHPAVAHAPRIALIGHGKDQSQFYPQRFPQWGAVNVENCAGVNATDIRNAFLGVGDSAVSGQAYVQGAGAELPSPVRQWLNQFAATEQYQELKAEQAFITHYKRAWASVPYEPYFVTVDAVVVQSGHVLLVERKARPGQGLLALPGGFVDPKERILDACLRELKEETRIKVPLPVLRGSIKRSDVFDEPYRSARGRTITHAFYIELDSGSELPKVKGGDDARTAQWVPLGELDPAQLFDDHYFIIQALTGA